MAVSFPQLDVYYIEFAEEHIDDQQKREKQENLLLRASGLLAHSMLPFGGLLRIGAYALAVGVSLSPDIISSLKRLIDENKFFVITSQYELDKFENACGNEWVKNSKALKQKQYYIRHPKKSNRNILVEAKAFYDYIEEEQKDELIDYILSHCPAKHIKIERTEVIKAKGKVKSKIEKVDAQGSIDAGAAKSDIFNYRNPKGIQCEPAYQQYVWLNNSIMRSISALSEGGSITQTYESDYTFGLSAGEAKTIGLDLSKHKKFTYLIHVEC